MTVRSILDRKKNGGHVVTIGANETILVAVQQMRRNSIRSLIVPDTQKPLAAIITGTDFLRAIEQCGSSIQKANVGTFATQKVETCTPDSKATDVLDFMLNHRLSHLPVIEKEKLAGIISIGDVAQYVRLRLLEELERTKDYIRTA